MTFWIKFQTSIQCISYNFPQILNKIKTFTPQKKSARGFTYFPHRTSLLFCRFAPHFMKSIDMNPKTNKILFYILLALSFITVVYIYITSDAPYDTGDGITHYLIARYSWDHPHQYLNMWGKPFFTLITSPVAQFRLKGN